MSDQALDTKKEIFTVILSFKNDAVTLKNSMIKELYFIEDIFSPCIVGKIHIIDKFGLKDNNLLSGGELVTIIYGIETLVQKTFYVYKISSISTKNPGHSQKVDEIEMFFVDVSFLIFSQKQISYSWTNVGGDEIIKDLLTIICKYPETMLGKWENSRRSIWLLLFSILICNSKYKLFIT